LFTVVSDDDVVDDRNDGLIVVDAVDAAVLPAKEAGENASAYCPARTTNADSANILLLPATVMIDY
jgi:hypothetical protein